MVFKNGGRRHLGFWKFEKFNRRYRPEGQHASLCKMPSKSVKWLRRNLLFDFSRWRPSAILDLQNAFLDHPRRAFGGLYRCAKFGWNRCSSFDDMQVSVFRSFGLKMPIQAPKSGVFGAFDPLNGNTYQNRSRGFWDMGGRNLPSPIDLAIGLYNSLHYRTSRDPSVNLARGVA